MRIGPCILCGHDMGMFDEEIGYNGMYGLKTWIKCTNPKCGAMMYSDKATEEERIKDLEERWKDKLGWNRPI